MIWSFCVLLACQAFGNVLHDQMGLLIPGTVLAQASELASSNEHRRRALNATS